MLDVTGLPTRGPTGARWARRSRRTASPTPRTSSTTGIRTPKPAAGGCCSSPRT
ncbi:hypothetical protein NKH77_42740 [Streptomyces sp. M19]